MRLFHHQIHTKPQYKSLLSSNIWTIEQSQPHQCTAPGIKLNDFGYLATISMKKSVKISKKIIWKNWNWSSKNKIYRIQSQENGTENDEQKSKVYRQNGVIAIYKALHQPEFGKFGTLEFETFLICKKFHWISIIFWSKIDWKRKRKLERHAQIKINEKCIGTKNLVVAWNCIVWVSFCSIWIRFLMESCLNPLKALMKSSLNSSSCSAMSKLQCHN